jgi:4-amino-4-deoxy-L-arabinose transferase-like glycosyltransferase
MNAEANKSNALPGSTTVNGTRFFPGYILGSLVGLFVLLIACIIILAYVPPVSRDALTHHLAVPKLYLKHGGIYEIPSIVFSYYPMNLDLLYMIPLYFGNDIAPKFIHFIFALMTAGLIYFYLRKRVGTVWGLFGAMFFLSLPIIVKLSITVYVDLGLVFFSTAAIMSLFKWIESRCQLKFLILSAVCCGLALGTKYNGLIVLFLLSIFIPFVFISHAKKNPDVQKLTNKGNSLKIQLRALGFGAIFCCIALLVFSPWMIRNYVWQGNPIYPLYHKFFSPQSTVAIDTPDGDEKPENSADEQPALKPNSTRWGPFAVRKVIFGETWWEILLIPIRIFFQGRDDHPKYFDGRLSPFLFLLPFFAFFRLKNNPAPLRTEKKFLAFFAILYLLYALSQTSIRIRYIAPIIPPLVILATYGLHQIGGLVANRRAKNSGSIAAVCVMSMAMISLFYNALYIQKQFIKVDPFSYITGSISRRAYITKYRPEYTIYQYANQHLSDRAKILGLFLGNRGYYSDREIIFGVDAFKKIVNSAGSDQTIFNDLRTKGFTHLMIRYDLFNQWTDKQFDDRQKASLKMFFTSHVRHILSKDGYGLFELNPMP